MLQGLGLGGGAAGEGGEAGALFPMMQTMLENILSKEILYPPIKEIVDKVIKYSDNFVHRGKTVKKCIGNSL